MEIEFATADIRALCEQERLMMKRFGKPGAKKLKSRLADLAAVAVVTELVAGRPHPLKGDRLGEFALDLQGATRLVFKATNDPVPRTQDGAIDWGSVTKVRIIFIGDYHD
ncbi:MAG: killer suppression protein HigA [Acidobacteria bacterium]|nr:MAG: killer suppression protein HigA [Acidobacteriota bacterium]